jgi:RNA polymerase sigma factor (sigma-70 family)
MTTSVVRQIESLYGGRSVAGLTDRQLVECFVTRRDAAGEDAFAALVARHGPMVLGVCRQLLVDRQRAEDAFQAVFLVLARRARSVRDPDLLANWLYGIAVRTARKARVHQARQRKIEEDRAVRNREAGTPDAAEQAAVTREQAATLHQEIGRLPGLFRVPVVLCYFDGLTLEEAARRLRCPPGTIHSRLMRARERLRRSLTRRGVVLPAAVLAATLCPRSASASVSSSLCEITTRAAMQFAAGRTTSSLAAVLAREVLFSIAANKLKLTVLTLIVLASVVAGVGSMNLLIATEEHPMQEPQHGASQLTARREAGQASAESSPEGGMIVSGRVLDAAGKPAAGVPVDLVGAPRAPEAGTAVQRAAFLLLGQGTTDADGRFRIEATRAGSARVFEVCVIAGSAGAGSGFGCLNLHPDAEEATVEMKLRPEQVIRGRLVDLRGKPAAGVEVGFNRVFGVSPIAGGFKFDSPLVGFNYVWSSPAEGLRAWPKRVVTDAQGRFAIKGVGIGLSAILFVSDPRFAQQRFDILAADRDETKEVTLTLQPATIIEGRARAADTGRPIPDAVISVRASSGLGGGMFTTKFHADAKGHFKISPYSGDYFRMRVYPPEGQPYLVRELEFPWTKGAVKKEQDVSLPRGVLIDGKVVEDSSGRPVEGASIQFVPVRPPNDIIHGFEAIVLSKEDGSFRVTVPSGKGHLMIVGPTLDYIPEVISGGKLYGSGQPGGMRVYAHDIIAYEFKPGESSQKITATLRPGKTLKGHVTGPGGESVQDAVILTRQQLDPLNLSWLSHTFIHTQDGRFELHGFDPEKPSPVYFLDAEHGWGAVAEFSGKRFGQELTVRLEPCGLAKARFVGPDGKPIEKLDSFPYLRLLMTSGPSNAGYLDWGTELAADEAYLPNVDPQHYQRPRGPLTDADGKITLPDLIPGAPYRIADWSTVNVQGKGLLLRKDFNVKAGEAIDLGEILVEQPQTR